MIFGRQRKPIEQVKFVIAGAQKSGTTALHYFLEKHPEIALPNKQELHFFDDDDLFARGANYQRLHQSFAPARSSVIAGECTPIYIYWEPAMERIWNYNQEMKLLIILRNPGERAFSHWNMQRERGYEPLDFLPALEDEKNRIREAAPLQLRKFSYLDRGFYTRQLERVFRIFPRRQVKIIKFEEFRTRQREILDSVFEFLGLEPLAYPKSREKNSMPYARPMTGAEKEFLADKYLEEIDRVQALLGWDCADWKMS